MPQRQDNRIHGTRDRGKRPGDGLRHRCIFAMNSPQNLDRGFYVEPAGAGIALLSRFGSLFGATTQ